MIINIKKSLFRALGAGDQPAMDKLVQKIKDPNIRNNSGEWLVVVSVTMNYTGFVKKLIDKGADVNSKSVAGKNLLALSFETNNPDLVILFHQKGLSVDANSYYVQKFFRSMVESNNIEMKKFLSDQGYDFKGLLGEEPEIIFIPIQQDNLDLFKLLLKYSLVPNVLDSKGNNLLHKCVEQGRPDMLRVIAESSVNIDRELKNLDGETPLEKAIRSGEFTCAKMLLPDTEILDDPIDLNNTFYRPCLSFWKKTILKLNKDLQSLPPVDSPTMPEVVSIIINDLKSYTKAYKIIINDLQENAKENIDIQSLKTFDIPIPGSLSAKDMGWLTLVREKAEGDIIRLLVLLENMTAEKHQVFTYSRSQSKALASLSKGIMIVGGTGRSIDEAFKVRFAKTSHNGVLAEHEYLRQYIENTSNVKLARPHFEEDGKLYDELLVEFNDGTTTNYFFDITDFFGLYSLEQIEKEMKQVGH